MQKAPEERRKVKQNYWFLTNETAYLNGQQPDGRRHRRGRRRRCGEPEVRKSYRKLKKSNNSTQYKVPASMRKRVLFFFANILPRGEQTDRRAAVVKPSSDALQCPYQER